MRVNMYKKYCIVCSREFESNSKFADVCSAACRSKKNEMPCKVRHLSPQEMETQSKNVKSNKLEDKSSKIIPTKLTGNMIQNMSWKDKYNSVDTMTKVSMLSKALLDINIKYSYGELRIIYDSDKNRYKELELKVMEIKK